MLLLMHCQYRHYAQYIDCDVYIDCDWVVLADPLKNGEKAEADAALALREWGPDFISAEAPDTEAETAAETRIARNVYEYHGYYKYMPLNE